MLINGYCFLLLSDQQAHCHWATAKADYWGTEMNCTNRATKTVGAVAINGRLHAVFECDDGHIRAVTMPAVRAMENRFDVARRASHR